MQNQFCLAKVEIMASPASSGNSEGESNSLPFAASGGCLYIYIPFYRFTGATN